MFKAYITNPQQLPDKTIHALFREFKPNDYMFYQENKVKKMRNDLEKFKMLSPKSKNIGQSVQKTSDFRIALLRVLCDYIGGMTDSYALGEYDKLY